MLYTIGGVIFLGILAQWVSWKFKVPMIITLLFTGVMAGPVFEVLNPAEHLPQDVILTLVELSVALILFDGAMQLKFSELRFVACGLKRILTLGVVTHFLLIASAAYLLVYASIGFSILLAGILIVTGPTVIIPALREAKIKKEVSHYLKWEGIITDPIGAILAILAYEWMALNRVNGNYDLGFNVFKIILVSFGLSFFLKEFVKFCFKKERVPEYLKMPFMVAVVICSFVFSERVQHGSGLLTVTILGMLLGNTKLNGLLEIKEFKENITTMCISFVFIIISASIQMETLLTLNISQVIFILLVSFLLRPMALIFSTIKSTMGFKEKLLISLYAPRGIVAVAVAAAISSEMLGTPFAKYGELFLPIILLTVMVTVVFHSLLLPILSKRLQLNSEVSDGVVIIGTMPWVVDLAKKLEQLGIPVLVTSASWYKLAPFRKAGIKTYYGQILDEVDYYDFSEMGSLLALSENDSFNSLACDRFTRVFGTKNVYKLKHNKKVLSEVQHQRSENYEVHNNHINLRFENLTKYYQYGWTFKITKITANFGYQNFLDQNEQAIICFKVDAQGNLKINNETESFPIEGDYIISYGLSRYDDYRYAM